MDYCTPYIFSPCFIKYLDHNYFLRKGIQRVVLKQRVLLHQQQHLVRYSSVVDNCTYSDTWYTLLNRKTKFTLKLFIRLQVSGFLNYSSQKILKLLQLKRNALLSLKVQSNQRNPVLLQNLSRNPIQRRLLVLV